jgi:hypothetical protein
LWRKLGREASETVARDRPVSAVVELAQVHITPIG